MTDPLYVSLLNEDTFDEKVKRIDISILTIDEKKCYQSFLYALYGNEEKFNSVRSEIDLENISFSRKSLIYEGLSIIAFYRKNYEEAINLTESELRHNPKSALSFFILANIKTTQKKYIEAIECYQKGLAIIPDHQDSIRNLISLYISKGITRAAAWEISKKLKPSLRTILYKAVIKLGWGTFFGYFFSAILFLLFLYPGTRLPTIISIGVITFLLEIVLFILHRNDHFLLRYILGYQLIALSELLLAILIWYIWLI